VTLYCSVLIIKQKKPVTKSYWFKSGWQDSNLRPPRPKRGAMTGLRYTPINDCSFMDGKYTLFS
jgi:hypothetical protein